MAEEPVYAPDQLKPGNRKWARRGALGTAVALLLFYWGNHEGNTENIWIALFAIGLVGTLIGLLLGGAVCAYLSVWEFPLDPKVYLIDHLPVRASASEFITTILIALFICTSATLIPSWWAARLLPADGIRPQ